MVLFMDSIWGLSKAPYVANISLGADEVQNRNRTERGLGHSPSGLFDIVLCAYGTQRVGVHKLLILIGRYYFAKNLKSKKIIFD